MTAEFCQNNCGKKLDVWNWGGDWIKKCPKHGFDIGSKELKERKPRFSGASKTRDLLNE